MNNIIWKADTSKYGNGKVAFSGKVKIGGYSWNAISKSPRFRTYSTYGDFILANGADTEDECRKLIEEAFDKYLGALGFSEAKNNLTLLKEIESIYSNKQQVSNLTAVELGILTSVQEAIKKSI